MSIPAQSEMFQVVLKQSVNIDVFSRKQMRQIRCLRISFQVI